MLAGENQTKWDYTWTVAPEKRSGVFWSTPALLLCPSCGRQAMVLAKQRQLLTCFASIALAERIQSMWCIWAGAGIFPHSSKSWESIILRVNHPAISSTLPHCSYSGPHYLQTFVLWYLQPRMNKDWSLAFYPSVCRSLGEANEEIQLRGDSTLVGRKPESRKNGPLKRRKEA